MTDNVDQPIQDGSDDLSALLAEFDASASTAPADAQPADAPQTPESQPAGPTLDDFTDPRYWELREQAAFASRATETAQQYLQQAAKIKDDADTESLIKEIRADLDPKAHPDKAVKAFIIGEAIESPVLHKIFLERASNPSAYAGMCRQLARNFHKLAQSRPDPDLTQDRDAIYAAVRGASVNRVPEERAPSYSQMNHNDFANDVKQRYGFNPMG